jgi:drug/metabolite transporter (DMT)-like permease
MPIAPRLPATVAGGCLMTAAAFAVALDTVIVRIVVQELHPAVIVLFRTLFGLLVLAPWAARAGASGFRTRKLPLHLVRALLKLGALVCFFYAVAVMPLAEATAIVFATPLFAAAGAVLFLGEHMSPRRAASTLAGFLGVLVILRPAAGSLGSGTLAAVAAALGLAAVGLMVKQLSRHDPPNTIVVLNLALSVPLALLIAVPFWTTPSVAALGWLVLQGLLGAAAQLSVTRAMRIADASLMMPIDFARLPFVAALAYAAFGEVPDLWTWVGAAVIGTSTLALLWAGGGGQRRG